MTKCCAKLGNASKRVVVTPFMRMVDAALAIFVQENPSFSRRAVRRMAMVSNSLTKLK